MKRSSCERKNEEQEEKGRLLSKVYCWTESMEYGLESICFHFVAFDRIFIWFESVAVRDETVCVLHAFHVCLTMKSLTVTCKSVDSKKKKMMLKSSHCMWCPYWLPVTYVFSGSSSERRASSLILVYKIPCVTDIISISVFCRHVTSSLGRFLWSSISLLLLEIRTESLEQQRQRKILQ